MTFPAGEKSHMHDRRWPNLFIVGAAKAGTSSLYHYLAQHPDVYMAPMKEPHFFSQIRPDPSLEAFFPHIADEADYLALFAAAGAEKVRGEASTSYLWDPDVADAIWQRRPDAKIVAVLRNPIDRAYSHYWNDVREGIEHRSFADAVSEEVAGPPGRWGVSSLYVDGGFYAERVKRYLDRFHQNVLVLFFEHFVADIPGTLRAVLAFLDVDTDWAGRVEPEARNPFALPRNAFGRRMLGSGTVRSVARILLPRSLRAFGRDKLVTRAEKPPMENDVRRRLLEIYQSDVQRLTDLVGRDPPWTDFGRTRPEPSGERSSVLR
jgi:hypothetical protein